MICRFDLMPPDSALHLSWCLNCAKNSKHTGPLSGPPPDKSSKNAPLQPGAACAVTGGLDSTVQCRSQILQTLNHPSLPLVHWGWAMVQTGITITNAMDAGRHPKSSLPQAFLATNNNKHPAGFFKFPIPLSNHKLIIVLTYITTSIVSNYINNFFCHLFALSHKALKL